MEKYSGKTILIVEDDNISRSLFREIFKNKGAKLHFVKDGKETLDFFKSNPVPNMVLMDIRLPDISGIDLTKQLIAEYPDIIIVAQTAFANISMEDNCFNAGMKAFITKPINASVIERTLDNLDW